MLDALNVNYPSWSDLRHFLPETILCATFLVGILADLLGRGRRAWPSFVICVAGTVTALAFAIADLPADPRTILGDLIVVDGMAAFFRILFVALGFLTLLFSWSSQEITAPKREHKGEYFPLIVLLTAGMVVMAEARDILMLFLSVEMVGLTSYVLAGYMRTTPRSTEASVKYVLYGAVSSGIMLYGLSLLYGLTGESSFSGIRNVISAGQPDPLALTTVTVLVLAGLGYKIALVPFHFWCPDVYEGSPTPVAAYFSVGPKAAAFALMIRFFYTTFLPGPEAAPSAELLRQVNWPLLIIVLSIATMTIGNVVALRQTNVKRMLAYSSIAHVGYLLMGFLLLTISGLQAILFYLIVYALMNLGAFLFVVAVNNHLKSEDLSDYGGLGFRAPWAGAMMVLFLLSLTGVPPTAGFIGKFYLFAEVINVGRSLYAEDLFLSRMIFLLAIIGVLNSVISLTYYFRIAKAMYFTPPREGHAGRLPLAPLHVVVLVLLAVPTLLLSVYWAPVKAAADLAVRRFTSM